MTFLNLKSVTCGSVLALALGVTAAGAADLGPYKPYNPPPAAVVDYGEPSIWQGAYVGVNGGYGWVDSGLNQPDGWFGGGQLGYNWQHNRLVFGVEADIQGADMNDSVGFIGPGGFSTAVTDINWFSTLRGRVGLASGPALIYATGGVAFADIDTAMAFGNGTSVSDHGVNTGYVVGAGVEWAFAPRWSMKAEYLYMDFGDQTLAGTGGVAVVDTDAQTMRVGLNYKF